MKMSLFIQRAVEDIVNWMEAILFAHRKRVGFDGISWQIVDICYHLLSFIITW